MEGIQEIKEMTNEKWHGRMAHATAWNGEIEVTRSRAWCERVDWKLHEWHERMDDVYAWQGKTLNDAHAQTTRTRDMRDLQS